MQAVAGLETEQTRGYDGAGVVALHTDGKMSVLKGTGLITTVFNRESVRDWVDLEAETFVMQTRYGTAGNNDVDNVQPFACHSQTDGNPFIFVHNGQFAKDPNHPRDGDRSDSYRFAEELSRAPENSWEQRLIRLQQESRGAWSTIVAIKNGLFLSRDPRGIRPLVYGQVNNSPGVWAAASETTALDAMGVTKPTEVLPGTIVRISTDGAEIIHNDQSGFSPTMCLFEDIYIQEGSSRVLAPRQHPEEIRGAIAVDGFRRECGRILAAEAPLRTAQVDFIFGVPATGIAGAKKYAAACGLPYFQLVHDRSPKDDQRTFMHANINSIATEVLRHFHIDPLFSLDGRRIGLVDDSLVRGNITRGLISLLRSSGVAEVHVRILSPMIDKACFLGINTRHNEEMIAFQQRHETDDLSDPAARERLAQRIGAAIGADSLAFLSDRGLYEATGRMPAKGGFCLGCMVNHEAPLDRFGHARDLLST